MPEPPADNPLPRPAGGPHAKSALADSTCAHAGDGAGPDRPPTFRPPLRAGDLPYYHWHWEVLPRTSRPAGLEWGNGLFVSAVPPEQAAAGLRASM